MTRPPFVIPHPRGGYRDQTGMPSPLPPGAAAPGIRYSFWVRKFSVPL